MPSRKPTPARRIGAKTSFLPEMRGAIMGCSGVRISTISTGRFARHLVAEQHADLVQQLPESLGGPLGVAHQRELVLNQRVGDDRDVVHGGPALSSLRPA